MTALFHAALSGSALIVVIVLLRLLRGNCLPHRVFPALWCCAALRLLLPVRLPSGLSVWNLLTQKKTGTAVAQLADALRPFSAAQRQVLTQTAQTAAPEVNLWLLLWALGAALVAGYLLLGAVRFSRRFAHCAPVENAAVQQITAQVPLWRSPIIRFTTDSRAPLTYGVVRPVVVLPAELLNQPEALRMVLLHELTHIRRMDCLRKLLFAVCLCLYWFNPLCWCMALLADRDIELACDEQTLRRLDATQKKTYALTLLQLAARQTRPHALTSAFGRPAVEERIKAIMNMKKLPRYLMVLAVVLAATLVTAFATQPTALILPQTQSVEDAQLPQVIPAQSEPAEMPAPVQEEAAQQDSASAPVQEEAAQQDSAPAPKYCFPLENAEAVVTDPFGSRTHPLTGQQTFHRGTDFAAMQGDCVLAVADGTVITSAYDEVFGNYILLEHADGMQTGYAHLQTLLVSEGQSVQQGQIIGLAGQTGWATGSHLHLEVLVDGEYVDPFEALQ